MPKYSYDTISNIFQEKGCKLLTTKEEFDEKKLCAKFGKFDIIARCGHRRENCRFKDFNSVGVGGVVS